MAGRLPALLALNAVAVIWGSQHAIIKTLVWASLTSDAPITLINSLRFTLAAVTTATLSACRACRARAMGHGHAREARIGAAPRTGLLRAAAELALWLVAGFTLQLVGLQWTSASRSAFLLYLNAVLVPFIACLMGERNIGLRTWVTAFAAVSGVPQHACTCTARAHALHMHMRARTDTDSTCACARACTARRAARALHMPGTLLLTHDGGPPNPGDVFSLGAAAASALYIVRLSALSAGHEAARLSAATLALSGAACMGITLAQAAAAGNLPGLALQVRPAGGGAAHALHRARTARARARPAPQAAHAPAHACTPTPRHGVHVCARHALPPRPPQAASLLRDGWRQLLYLSVAVTATANLLQAFGQQRVGAAEAAVIYTMDPVYGALFAWLLLGERLHAQRVPFASIPSSQNRSSVTRGAEEAS